MNGRAMICAGIAGAVVAAICCATPILAVVLPLIGLGMWLGRADVALLALLAASLGLVGLGLYRRSADARCCETSNHKEDLKA